MSVHIVHIDNLPYQVKSMNKYKEMINFKPDVKLHKLNGFRCLTKTNHLGCLCGYVKVSIDDKHEIACHGGITWNTGDYIGFDCGHFGDVVPMFDFARSELAQLYPEKFENHPLSHSFGTWKNHAFVLNELKSIVEQLKQLGYKSYNQNQNARKLLKHL